MTFLRHAGTDDIELRELLTLLSGTPSYRLPQALPEPRLSGFASHPTFWAWCPLLPDQPTDRPTSAALAAQTRGILPLDPPGLVLLTLDYFEALTPLRTLLQPQLPDDLGRRALAQACSFALPRPTSAGASCPEAILSSVALGCCPVATGTDNCVSLRRDNTDINRWVEMVQSLPGDLTAF